METEDIRKEIDLIQDVIKRMADNSFKVKAWSVGILGAMVTLSEKKLFATCPCNRHEALLLSFALLLPVLCFWYLDSFFLSTEKLYREIYTWVVANRSKTAQYLFDLNTFTRTVDGTTEYLDKAENSVISVMFSKTIIPFHSIPFILVIAIIVYNILR